MAAPQKKVAVKKTASKKKVSGEFKAKSGSSPRKVKAFKKPDLIVKQKSVSKKLLGAGLGLFASGAIAGTLAASLLKKKSVVPRNSVSGDSEFRGTDPVSIAIQNNIREKNEAIEEADKKTETLKAENSANLEAIKKHTGEIALKDKEIKSLKSQLDAVIDRVKVLQSEVQQKDIRIQFLLMQTQPRQQF